MTQHKSLKSHSGRRSKGHRNVLKRFERIEKLKAEGKWTAENSIYGLPKVKSLKIKKKGKAAEKPTATALISEEGETTKEENV